MKILFLLMIIFINHQKNIAQDTTVINSDTTTVANINNEVSTISTVAVGTNTAGTYATEQSFSTANSSATTAANIIDSNATTTANINNSTNNNVTNYISTISTNTTVSITVQTTNTTTATLTTINSYGCNLKNNLNKHIYQVN
jgi:hypothetical protein